MGWNQLPEGTGKITREQFISVVSESGTHVSLARYRLEDVFGDNADRDTLDDVEKKLHDQACSALKALQERAEMPAMVKLAADVQAAENEENERTGADIPEDEIAWSRPVDKALDYGSPVGDFLQRNTKPEGVRLAFAILESLGYEEYTNDLLSVLAGERTLYRGYGSGGSKLGGDWPVHYCPRCEGEGTLTTGRYANDICNRCRGWGHLLQKDAPEDEEDTLTLAGRIARNEGKPWTIEDEILEVGYDSLSEALADNWEQPKGIWPQPAGTC
jgi:hypothetical protein